MWTKNNIILWLSSLLVVFIVSYLKNIYSENYPITGTIGIQGKKLSYKLDKVGYGNNHKLLLRSDVSDLIALVVIHKQDSLFSYHFSNEGKFLSAYLNKKIIGDNFKYHLIIKTQNEIYRIPQIGNVNFRFYGKIPKMLSAMFYLFLYTGLILIMRSGLEFFNNNILTKKLLLLSSAVWFTFVMLINPLYLSFKHEYINKTIAPIQSLFSIQYTAILFLLIIAVSLSFNKRFVNKPISLFSAILVIILFLL